jgi:peptidyl-prolyl cis-trans isomerase SurA
MTKIAGRRIVAVIAVLVLLGLVRTGVAEVVDRIVAEVNDEIITMSELQNMAKAIQTQSGVKPTGQIDSKVQREMLEALIDRKLAKAEAKRRGITVAPKELEEALVRFKQRNNIPDDETLAKALANQGLSLKEFKQQISDQMIRDRLLAVAVGTKISVSDADVQRFYDQHFKQGGAQVRLLTVSIPFPPGATDEQKEETKRKAESILEDVQRGISFAEAAGKLSLSPSDLGYVSQSDLDPRLAEYLDKIKPKEVAPVATPEGFQLVQIVDRRSGQARSFAEAAPQIRQILSQQEMEKQFTEWVKTLRGKAHIKVML